jgi:hypothetical protein
MDIARIWRDMSANPSNAPHAGAHLATPGEDITMSVTQECQVALPWGNQIPEFTVIVTSNRPGVAADVTIAANVNSMNGNYQGPTTIVGQGQFTATNSEVRVGFIMLPSGFPVAGVSAQAIWADGAPHSITLNYYLIACDPLVWWVRWIVAIVGFLRRPFVAEPNSTPPSGGAE